MDHHTSAARSARGRHRQDGQALTEYVLIISFVAIAAMAVVAAFGLGLLSYLSNIASAVGGVL